MAYMRRLDTVQRMDRLFHLPAVVAGFDALEYYLVHAGEPRPNDLDDIGLWSPFNILAVAARADRPSELTLRQLHLEEEEFDEAQDLNPWTDCMGGFGLQPPEFESVRDFLRALAARLPLSPTQPDSLHVFLPATVEDYVACGIPRGMFEIDMFGMLYQDGYLYQLSPLLELSPQGGGSFTHISTWTLPLRSPSTSAYLRFETYSPARIAEIQSAWQAHERRQPPYPYIDAGMLDAATEICLTRGGLLELADFLTERLQGYDEVENG